MTIIMAAMQSSLLTFESSKTDWTTHESLEKTLDYSMSAATELTNTTYDILKVLGKDADFLYDTIETYIQDAQKANKSERVQIWQAIKNDRKYAYAQRSIRERNSWVDTFTRSYQFGKIKDIKTDVQ